MAGQALKIQISVECCAASHLTRSEVTFADLVLTIPIVDITFSRFLFMSDYCILTSIGVDDEVAKQHVALEIIIWNQTAIEEIIQIFHNCKGKRSAEIHHCMITTKVFQLNSQCGNGRAHLGGSKRTERKRWTANLLFSDMEFELRV